MNRDIREVTPKQLIEANDWWCLCKHKNFDAIEFEEKAVACFALCDVWEPCSNEEKGGYESVEVIPVLVNECGRIKGLSTYNFDYDDLGDIVDIYKGQGNYKNKDIKLVNYDLEY